MHDDLLEVISILEESDVIEETVDDIQILSSRFSCGVNQEVVP
jgi:hypothetical protein